MVKAFRTGIATVLLTVMVQETLHVYPLKCCTQEAANRRTDGRFYNRPRPLSPDVFNSYNILVPFYSMASINVGIFIMNNL